MDTPLSDALPVDYRSKTAGETRDHPAAHNLTNAAVKEVAGGVVTSVQWGNGRGEREWIIRGEPDDPTEADFAEGDFVRVLG